jgi:hypothetical protein
VVKRLVSADSESGALAPIVLNNLDSRFTKSANETVNVARFVNTQGKVDQDSFTQAAAAAGAGGTIFLPRSSSYAITAPFTLTDINIESDGAQVNVPSDLGAGVYAMTINGSGSYPIQWISNFSLNGPNVTTPLGVKPNAMHGIHVTGGAKPRFAFVTVRFFDRGVTYRTFNGHIYLSRCNLTANYYGLYLAQNSSDYFIEVSELNGNKFAGIGMPADQGFDGMAVRDSHMGFQPYGVFQEATTESGSTDQGVSRVFIQDATFDHCRFEAIGNGAIVSAAKTDATNRSTLSAVKIIQPGFSWNTTYRLANRGWEVPIDIGFFDRTLEIESGAFPFLAGSSGKVIRVQQPNGGTAITLRGPTNTVSSASVIFGQNAANCAVTAGLGPVVSVPAQRYVAGLHYSAAAPRTTASRPNGFATLLPVPIGSSRTFTGMGVEIVTAGESGSKVRLGVYSDSGGAPGNLVADAGQVPADTTGLKTITGLTITLEPGWYYLAATVQSASTTSPVMRAIVGSVSGAPLVGGQLTNGAGWQQGGLGQGLYPTTISGVGPTDTAVVVSLIG